MSDERAKELLDEWAKTCFHKLENRYYKNWRDVKVDAIKGSTNFTKAERILVAMRNNNLEEFSKFCASREAVAVREEQKRLSGWAKEQRESANRMMWQQKKGVTANRFYEGKHEAFKELERVVGGKEK